MENLDGDGVPGLGVAGAEDRRLSALSNSREVIKSA